MQDRKAFWLLTSNNFFLFTQETNGDELSNFFGAQEILLKNMRNSRISVDVAQKKLSDI